MCPHHPPCPDSRAAGRLAARRVASQHGQGWSLLCNGVIVFDDGGALLPDGRAMPAAAFPPATAAPPAGLAAAA
jgi:hypothetical protein